MPLQGIQLLKKICVILETPLGKKNIHDLYVYMYKYMLWFKFSFSAKFLKLVQFLFSFVMYSLPYPSSKNIKPRINLNHNIYHILGKKIHVKIHVYILYIYVFSIYQISG